MGYRLTPLVTGEIYHVFNRSIASQPIFLEKRDYQRFLQTIDFYRFSSPPLRFSFFKQLSKDQRNQFLQKIYQKQEKNVAIYAFCLMPNHFHFLLKQTRDGGIKEFISNLQNSYAKYFNTKTNRSGSLFQGSFKAVLVETKEQFIHLARYIHLNPYSSFKVKDLKALETFRWSSLGDYLDKENHRFVEKELLLSFYPSIFEFQKFTFNHADYQRQLEMIKHLLCE